MSEDFFEQLNIPQPDLNLGVGSGTQAFQTGQIMLKYEEAIKSLDTRSVYRRRRCDLYHGLRYYRQERMGQSGARRRGNSLW